MELSRQQGALPSASRSKWKLSYTLGSFEAVFVEECSSLCFRCGLCQGSLGKATKPLAAGDSANSNLRHICYVMLHHSCSVLADSCIEVVALARGSKADFSSLHLCVEIFFVHCNLQPYSLFSLSSYKNMSCLSLFFMGFTPSQLTQTESSDCLGCDAIYSVQLCYFLKEI